MTTRFYGGSIYLGSGNWVNEIYVTDGRVAKAMEPLSEIDLQGNTLLPAFRDGHAHPFFAGKEINSLDVTNAESLLEIGERLKKYRESNRQLTWVSGGAYNRALPGMITREFLDNYVNDVPVTIHADDHHTLWVNSKALEVAGLLTRDLPKISVGSIDLGPDGFPNGVLRETEAIDLIARYQPNLSSEQKLEAHLSAEKSLINAGIVSVQDAWVDEDLLASYLANKAKLKLDYQLAVLIRPNFVKQDFETAKKAVSMFENDLKLSVQAVKIFIDGVFGSATAAVSEPYLSTGLHGDLNWQQEHLTAAINSAHELGLQAHIHAIGDKAIDLALSAVAVAKPGKHPSVLAHAELTNSALLDRIKQLRVTLCVQPYWAQNNDMLLSCVPHLGSERINSLYAFKDMLDHGINLVFSSDWPVSSNKPLEGIAVAVHRQLKPEMVKHNAMQSISLEDAIDAYTLANMKMLGREASILQPGDFFDAVIIEGDIKLKNLEALASSKVLAVYKQGVNLLPEHQH